MFKQFEVDGEAQSNEALTEPIVCWWGQPIIEDSEYVNGCR